MPRHRSAHLGVGLRLGELKARIYALSGPPRLAVLHLGEPLCLGIALLRLSVPTSPVLVPLFC